MDQNKIKPTPLRKKGWSRICPQCEEIIYYTKLSGMSSHKTQFYEAGSNNVLLANSLANHATEEDVSHYLTQKNTETGLNFQAWTNISCPHCHYQFPYSHRLLADRLKDNVAILMDGSLLIDKDKWFKISVLKDAKMTLKEKTLEYCEDYAAHHAFLTWHKTKKQFRWNIFPDVTLCIDPVISFNNGRGLMQPHVQVLFKPYQKIKKKIMPKSWEYCLGYKIHYYDRTYPLRVIIYETLPERIFPYYHTVAQMPFILEALVDMGLSIFEKEHDLSSKDAFINSMFIPQDDPRMELHISQTGFIGITEQVILHLMRGNIDILYDAVERYEYQGGSHLEFLPRIIDWVETHGIEDIHCLK